MTAATDWSVELREATQADIDALHANASAGGESAAIWINGQLAAVGDEYGTATIADWLPGALAVVPDDAIEAAERFFHVASDLVAHPKDTP